MADFCNNKVYGKSKAGFKLINTTYPHWHKDFILHKQSYFSITASSYKLFHELRLTENRLWSTFLKAFFLVAMWKHKKAMITLLLLQFAWTTFKGKIYLSHIQEPTVVYDTRTLIPWSLKRRGKGAFHNNAVYNFLSLFFIFQDHMFV